MFFVFNHKDTKNTKVFVVFYSVQSRSRVGTDVQVFMIFLEEGSCMASRSIRFFVFSVFFVSLW